MITHQIADLKVGIEYKHPRMINQAAAYVVDDTETDFNIDVPQQLIENMHRENPHLTIDSCEYMATSFVFYRRLVDYGGMMLHASAVIKDGYAYLFSAPSGTGKSTHTELWLKVFPEAEILNDDKPAIRCVDGKVNVYGTPWSGKTSLNLNKCIPIGGICFLERSETNFIDEITTAEAIPLLLNQTIRPKMKENMDKLLNVLETILNNTKVYRMGCTISEEAAIMAYEKMKEN